MGLETNVLFEDDVTEGRMEGFTPNYIRVAAKYDPLPMDEMKPLRLTAVNALGLMRRRYKRALYASRVARIKELIPHACIGVDVIVGFPGETDSDFLDTYNFLSELPISYLHVFPYSERPDTLAPTLPGRVQDRVRHERTTQLRSLS